MKKFLTFALIILFLGSILFIGCGKKQEEQTETTPAPSTEQAQPAPESTMQTPESTMQAPDTTIQPDTMGTEMGH